MDGLLDHFPIREEPARRVRGWLEARPHIQKEIVLAWLRQRDPDDWFCEALHRSKLPPDFGPWCFDQAIEIGDTEPQVSEGLLLEAYRSLRNPSASADLTLESMRDRLRNTPTLAAHLESFCERHSRQASIDDKHQRERRERREKWEEEQRQRSEGWATHLREHKDELLDNRFSPQNLATLANVHFGLLAGGDRHRPPRDSISDFIGGDPCLVDAVIAALRATPLCETTCPRSIRRSHGRSSRGTRGWPARCSPAWTCSTGTPRIASTDSNKRRSERRWRSTIASRTAPALRAGTTAGSAPIPTWSSASCTQCAVADVRAGKDLPSGLNELDGAEGHRDEVHNLRMSLLEAFPTRSSNEQLPLLDRLLTRALDYPDHAALLTLTERKQTSTSMPIGQRVRWWATGALIVQDARLQQLNTDLANREVRVRHLATFLRSVWDRHDRRSSILADIEDPAALRELIEILGHWCTTPRYGSGFVTLEMEMSDLIGRLIGQLGSEPGDRVRQALTDLLEDPALGRLASAPQTGAGRTSRHPPRRLLQPSQHRTGPRHAQRRATRQRGRPGGAASGPAR